MAWDGMCGFAGETGRDKGVCGVDGGVRVERTDL
jgi:hypothetical protein